MHYDALPISTFQQPPKTATILLRSSLGNPASWQRKTVKTVCSIAAGLALEMDFKLDHSLKNRNAPKTAPVNRSFSRRAGNASGSLSAAPKIDNEAAIKSTSETRNSKTPDVSKAIEKVLLSKTQARRQRQLEGLQTTKYQSETQRPLVCLAFVLPLLLFYEVGSIFLADAGTYSASSLRSGVDQWFHQFLQQFGFGQLVLLPLVTVGVILAWHHRVNDHWRIRPAVLMGMLTEAAGLGLILFCAANSLNLLFGGVAPAAQTSTGLSVVWWANVVGCVGSGIYEELIFRVVLLVPAIYWLTRTFKDRKLAVAVGVGVVSLIFASMHYNVFNPAGNQFELSSFMFRFSASIVFCALFLYRGFGIAVGAHVAYDVLTQV